jgi:hypothetical protein
MSAQVTLVNKTSSKVTFGLWSAPHDEEATKEVASQGSDVVTLDHPDARIIGVWTDSNNLYPSNDSPLTAGSYFGDSGNYTVSLTADQLSISAS